MSKLVIPFGSGFLGEGHPAIIIAEIGINHEGSPETCARMIEAAKRAGVTTVKLQTSNADEHYLPDTESYNIYKSSALDPAVTAEMFEYAKCLGLDIFTTCGDMETLAYIEKLRPSAYKISSGMLGNLPMIREFALTGRPLLFSSGMSTLEDLDLAIGSAVDAGAKHLAVMQCVSLYPAKAEQMNLRAMKMLESRYHAPSGLSDHSLGIEVSCLAVAAGAHVIEKHFSLDPTRDGFDHGISLDESGFNELVMGVRRVESILGDGVKRLDPEELLSQQKYARFLVLKRDVCAGEILGRDDLSIKRVKAETNGLRSILFDAVLGAKILKNKKKFDVLMPGDILWDGVHEYR